MSQCPVVFIRRVCVSGVYSPCVSQCILMFIRRACGCRRLRVLNFAMRVSQCLVVLIRHVYVSLSCGVYSLCVCHNV